jgi:TRAP-type C4-dicarboxylate transport system permease small subunit
MTMNIDEQLARLNHLRSGPTVWSRERVSFRAPLLDIIAGVVLTLLALCLWFGADYIDNSTNGIMGPAGFPRGIALIFGVTSLLMAIQGVNDLRNERNGVNVGVDQPLAVVANLALVVVYPILLGHFGYYLATGPWLLALLFVTGFRKPVPMLLCAGGFLAVTKLVFEMLVGIPLP